MTTQPEAFRLADKLEAAGAFTGCHIEAAAELRRLHEELELQKALVAEAQEMAIKLSGANQELLEALKVARREAIGWFDDSHGFDETEWLEPIDAAIAKHGGQG